jgi:hypothetical protein
VINAVALNADHLLAEETAQFGGIVRWRKTGSALLFAAGLLHFSDEFGMANELVREVMAVLKKIDRAARQFRVAVQRLQPLWLGDDLFEKGFKAVATAEDASGNDGTEKFRGALFEVAAQIGGREFGAIRRGPRFWFRGSFVRRSGRGRRRDAGFRQAVTRVNHALIQLLDISKMMIQLAFERARARQAWRAGRHLAREQVQIVGSARQCVGLAVLIELEPVLDVPQELISRGQTRIFRAGEMLFIAQAGEREQSAAVPHPGVTAAIEPLQALHQKFDIADAAGSQFHIEGRITPPLIFFVNAGAGLGNRLDGAEIRAGSPAQTRALISICNSQSRPREA